MKISICIPMYNEAKVIAGTAIELTNYMASSSFADYEVIFCNDGSSDGCEQILLDMALPHVRVVGYKDNRGKGYAVRHAMLSAAGDIRIFTDSDLAYGVDVIKSIVEIFERYPQTDLVTGSRTLHKDGYAGYSLKRKIFSRAFLLLVQIIGGFRVSDSQCGCKAYSAAAAERIFKHCTVDGFAFDFETLILAKKFHMHIVPLPVRIINHGDSKVRLLRDSVSMLLDLISIRIKTAFKRYK